MKTVNLSALALAVLVSAGCGTRTGNGLIPLVSPPVKAAAPTALGGTATRALARAVRMLPTSDDFFTDRRGAISISDFATRFFQSGPTNVYTILQAIDTRIDEINSHSTSTAACLTQTPVSYDIRPFGQTVPMHGQCYQTIGTNGFLQWGVSAGVTYLWAQVGAGNLAAILTPVGNSYSVQAWATVGNAGTYNSNGTTAANWDTIGSYGVMQLSADASRRSLELVAAGIGMGYCGAHLISDGTNIYGEGSLDMGSTCDASTPICVSAADITTAVPGACSVTSASFALASLGRMQATSPDPGSLQNPPAGGVYGASAYPAVPNITLDGTATDSLAFGPTTPTSGVGRFE